jgi:cysteine desulfurase/selenocysteine lyase
MQQLRKEFPLLNQKFGQHSLIYFDNGATSQKPQQVIDALTRFYTQYNSNIGRSIYPFGEQTTMLYEHARQKVAQFINADASEIIFTKGATESINAVASSWGAQYLKKGDEIVITQMEHHSNLIPWQQQAHTSGAVLKYIPLLSDGTLDLSVLPQLFTQKTKIVAVTHVSNALGTHNDIETIIKAAHAVGARVLIDAAQSAPHQKIDVKKLQCDFLVFSGHKMLAPTGIGVLYIKKDLHEQMNPYQFGGGMVYEADLHNATWQKAPHKFEAGTPPIAQAIALGVAVDYLTQHVPFDALQKHEAALCARLITGLSRFKKITVLGPVPQLQEKGHLVSFIIEGIHAHDVASFLGNYGICVRAGNHCAQPLAKELGIVASVRVSFYLYNTLQEVDTLLEVLEILLNKSKV